MKKQLWIGFLIAGVCLYFAFRGISFQELGHSLRQANLAIIAPALLLYLFDFAIRTIRWQGLLKPLCQTNFFSLFHILVLGFFANNILPFRLGEIARAVLCSQKFSIPKTSALGTVVMERLCDAISFLFVFFVASIFFPFPGYMKKGASAMGASCIVLLVLLFLLKRHEPFFRRTIARLPLSPAWSLRFTNMLAHLAQSTMGVMRGPYFVSALALSLVVWTTEATFLYLIARAFELPLPFSGAFFLLFALGLSVALPQAPGYVGTFEFFGVTALVFLGIPKEQGLPMVLTVHGLQFAVISVLGMIALWREGLNLKSLTSASDRRL